MSVPDWGTTYAMNLHQLGIRQWLTIAICLGIGAVVLYVLIRGYLKRDKNFDVTSVSKKEPAAPQLTPSSSAHRARFASAIRSWIPLLKENSRDTTKWEEMLLKSDMGPKLSLEIVQELEKTDQTPSVFLKSKLESLLMGADSAGAPWKQNKPWVLFVVGVNGVGKTTTLVKLVNYLISQHRLSVGVVGADTFRKAAVEQLQRGVEQVGGSFFTLQGSEGSEGADPAAVVFDGLKRFQTMDAILVDTSGRLQNKKNLMEELKKMKRVAEKAQPGSPNDVWLIIDATLGQNAVDQGRAFHEAIGLTGLVLTKLDGLSRGGTVFQLYQELRTPIHFLGVGEAVSDLEPFKTHSFVEELFDPEAVNS